MLVSISNCLEKLGGIANAFGIGGPILGGIWLAVRNRHALFGPSKAAKLIAKQVLPRWSPDNAKALGTVAVVDDHLTDFPLGELRRSGYNITSYKQVTLSDLEALERFDLVFLDIKGVVRDNFDEGGLKVLAKLREENPHQKICAVSSQKFDPTATAFFKRADDVQTKPISAHKCKEVIDSLLSEKLDPRELGAKVDAAIGSLSQWRRRTFLRCLSAMSVEETKGEKLDELMSRFTLKSDQNRYLFIDFARVIRRESR